MTDKKYQEIKKKYLQYKEWIADNKETYNLASQLVEAVEIGKVQYKGHLLKTSEKATEIAKRGYAHAKVFVRIFESFVAVTKEMEDLGFTFVTDKEKN